MAEGCYIKSTDADTFCDHTIGTHVYSDESCETPAADGEYLFNNAGLADYSEEAQVLIGVPEISSFTVADGVIIDTADAQADEEEGEE